MGVKEVNMFELKSNIVKKYDRSVPDVNFENDEILWKLVNIINTDRNIYQYIGLLLLRFGFEPEDSVLLCNYNHDDCSFDCVLNKKECYRIKFNFPCSKIIISRHNMIYGYECEPLECSELKMKVSLGSYSYTYEDGMRFTRYLSREKVRFAISICDYVLEFELDKPDDIDLGLFDEYGSYAKYRLDNEEDLTNYLSSLKIFSKSIVDIYYELCEKYIDDVRRYPNFSLKLSTLDSDGNLKLIDLIHLKYGELEKFGMTAYGRTIFLDKDDNWSYEMPQEGSMPVEFLMSSYNGKISCRFVLDENDYSGDNYLFDGIKNDINIVMDEVRITKRKVREIFDNKI